MTARRQLLTPAEAAERLGLSVERLYRASQAGLVPRVHIGRSVRFDPAALDAFVKAGGASVAPVSADRREVAGVA